MAKETSVAPKRNGLRPIHPGEMLREDVFPAIRLTKTEIAERLGVSRQTLHKLLNEEQPVTANLALRLERLVGGTAASWLSLQSRYDLAIEGKRLAEDLAKIERAEAA